jgi:hypothetical protein
MRASERFFLPVRALSRLFRRFFLQGLAALHKAERLAFFGHKSYIDRVDTNVIANRGYVNQPHCSTTSFSRSFGCGAAQRSGHFDEAKP